MQPLGICRRIAALLPGWFHAGFHAGPALLQELGWELLSCGGLQAPSPSPIAAKEQTKAAGVWRRRQLLCAGGK